MPTFTSADASRTVTIVSGTEIDANVAILQSLDNALNAFNAVAPLASLTSNSSTSIFALKDGRSVTYTLIFGANPPATITFCVSSGSYWSGLEFGVIQALAQVFTTLELVYGLSALEITYA